jgi:hypothetical protein
MSGLAADFAVHDYDFAYRHLADWPGGKSRDPGIVGHIHISYAPGSREFGSAFCHRGYTAGGGCSQFAGGRRHFAARRARAG